MCVVTHALGCTHCLHADGVVDDTAAFERAFKDFTGPGPAALNIPAGTYRIMRPLEKWSGSIVLKGAGVDKTKLYFPKSMADLYGNKFREGEGPGRGWYGRLGGCRGRRGRRGTPPGRGRDRGKGGKEWRSSRK